jgi:peptidoglycan L-alanyl-D-glutamate endopeptidase CwlK
MKLHSEFTAWLGQVFPNTEQSLLQKIVQYTSPGVAPEGCNLNAKLIAEFILKNPSFMAESTSIIGIPIQPPPVEEIEAVVKPVKPEFFLGARSLDRLKQLKPSLAFIVKEAIGLTICDFTVMQTSRSLAEQESAVATGHSRTMKSKHLLQSDGFAWAVDLGAWVNEKISWDETHYADIAFAIDQAATKHKFEKHVRWGGAWDRVLADFGGSHDAYLEEAKAYATRFRLTHPGKHPLVDLPHFEWVA